MKIGVSGAGGKRGAVIVNELRIPTIDTERLSGRAPRTLRDVPAAAKS